MISKRIMNKSNTVIHTPSKIIVLLASLLFIISACSSTPDNSKGAYLSPIPTTTFTPSHPISLSPLPATPPLSDSALAMRIVQGMSLDQKLGQMVIVEFYGATVNSDLTQMIQHNQVSGVLIENKNGNAQSRGQLVSLIQSMQKQAPVPLFITTDFEGGVVNELRQITGERTSEQAIGASGNPTVAYNAGHSA
ncbi:MAG: hypothetical protein E6I91_21240, partial [Chloroflexi bacterium]